MHRLPLLALTVAVVGCGSSEDPVVGARRDALATGKTINRLCHTTPLSNAQLDRLTSAVRRVDRLQRRYPDDDRVQRVADAALTVAGEDCPGVDERRGG